MENQFTLSFAHPDCQNIQLTGGKCSNLAKMTQVGLPVPKGFAVTTKAFDRFGEFNQITKEINSILDQLCLDDTAAIKIGSAKIRAVIETGTIPIETQQEIQKQLNLSNFTGALAVRSSATAEDLAAASFAGQQDSYLNIIGVDQILNHIRKCWASLYTERAIIYRIQNNFDHHKVKIAVAVQEMVQSDISGIIFTADPVSNNHHIITINAGFGLGEALVSGIVTPDLYYLDKSTGSLINAKIASKETKIESLASGGVKEVKIEKTEEQEKETLTENDLHTLWDLALNIEAYYKTPQDIEWAIKDGKVYMLQTRPITSLFPIPQPIPNDLYLRAYFSVGHAQMMTKTISPMGIDILRRMLPFGRPPKSPEMAPYLLFSAGRLYADLTSLINTRPGKKIIPRMLSVAEPIAAQQLKTLIEREDYISRNKTNPQKAGFAYLRDWMLPILGGVLSWMFFRKLDNQSKKALEINAAFLQNQKVIFSQANTPTDTLDAIKATSAYIMHEGLLWIMPLIANGVIARVLLERILLKFGLSDKIPIIQRGFIGNITTEMDLAVGDIADEIQKYPKLKFEIKKYLNKECTWEDINLEKYPNFFKAWNSFILRFGMRGPGEIDIGNPRWQDDPRSILQTVLANATHNTTGSHRAHFDELIHKNQTAQAEIISTFKSSFKGRLFLPIVKRLLKLMSELAPIREHPKYLIVRILDLYRQNLINIAKQLNAAGQIARIDDIWYLDLDVLETHFIQPNINLAEIIETRKAEYAHFQKLTPPRLMTSDGEILKSKLHREGLPENALIGSPVSAGKVKGIAKVITDPNQEQLSPGEILVAPFTDPGWTPLFINAAGVVLETGGLMTHGSVVAREYGLPGVVGIIDATSSIKSGDHIFVDGDEGFVQIL